jgi:hypothetical protein
MPFSKRPIAGLALLAALALPVLDATAHDESKYPDWSGQWRRPRGLATQWDQDKKAGLAQEAPLKPEYQKMLEWSMADQAAGGQGLDTRYTCITNGMPRMMAVIQPVEFVILPSITYVHFEAFMPRRIYTDGRDFPQDAEPSFAGYSIGKWSDTDGDGRFDTLEVETRNFKGPRNYEPSGIPLHDDNETIIRERMYLDKSSPDTLVNEITTTDNALTKPWKVVKNYRREKNAEWYEDLCTENNNHVMIGKENYFMSADGYLMPAKKGQQPPDLRYFNTTGN